MTLFEKIAQHDIPAEIIHEDEELVAFRDIAPQAPVHLIIIPRKPIPSVNELEAADAELAGKMIILAKDIARHLGLRDKGYRLVFNCGEDGGQTVNHLHLHLLGGRPMSWPPG